MAAAFVDCLHIPTFSRNLAQYRPYTKPIVTFTMASSSDSRRARVPSMDGTLLGHVSLLPGQTILDVRKPEFDTASARCCTKTKSWRPEFGPQLTAKCIPELSFQQRHDTGNRSSATFLSILAQSWVVSNFTLGYVPMKILKMIKRPMNIYFKLSKSFHPTNKLFWYINRYL